MLGVWLKERETRGGKVMSLRRRKGRAEKRSDKLVDDSRGFGFERWFYQRFEGRLRVGIYGEEREEGEGGEGELVRSRISLDPFERSKIGTDLLRGWLLEARQSPASSDEVADWEFEILRVEGGEMQG